MVDIVGGLILLCLFIIVIYVDFVRPRKRVSLETIKPKSEIPMPEVKLPPPPRRSISGWCKDNKCEICSDYGSKCYECLNYHVNQRVSCFEKVESRENPFATKPISEMRTID